MADSSKIRISDSERESALKALGEHMNTGRLSVDEYGERSAEVTVARTQGDLIKLFDDLPEPHPAFDPVECTAESHPEQVIEKTRAAPERHPVVKRATKGAVLVIAATVVGLYLITGFWGLLVIATGLAVTGGLVLVARHAKGPWKQDSEFDAAFDNAFNATYDLDKARHDRKAAKEYSRNYTRNYMRKYNERGHWS